MFHINDSKNPRGAAKDRHENIGFGEIGFATLNHIVHHEDFTQVPKILETPYIKEKGPKILILRINMRSRCSKTGHLIRV